jgi:hypothetical protein
LLANRIARDVFGNDLVGETCWSNWLTWVIHVVHGVRPALSAFELVEFRDIHQRSLRMELAPLLPAEGDITSAGC